VASAGAGNQPVLDLIFLGMGEDGHVASLFPTEPESMVNDAAVFRAVVGTKPPPNRITIGYQTIAAAREVWVLASGAGKEQALRESTKQAGQTPLARVLRLRSQTTVFTDVRLT
jgi:6-phosphogluconolactonase